MAVMEQQVPAWAEANRPRVLAALDRLDRGSARAPISPASATRWRTSRRSSRSTSCGPSRIAVPERCVRLGAWRREIAARRALAA
jgi:hypothetical protein